RTHVPLTGQDAFEAPPLRPLRYLSVRGRARPAACVARVVRVQRTNQYSVRTVSICPAATRSAEAFALVQTRPSRPDRPFGLRAAAARGARGRSPASARGIPLRARR